MGVTFGFSLIFKVSVFVSVSVSISVLRKIFGLHECKELVSGIQYWYQFRHGSLAGYPYLYWYQGVGGTLTTKKRDAISTR